jgi:hypothetical protein
MYITKTPPPRILTESFTVRFPLATLRRYAEGAKRDGRTLSDWIRRALDQHAALGL